jgi:hypothetical protein
MLAGFDAVFAKGNELVADFRANEKFSILGGALHEIDAFFKRSHKVIVALTVQEILDEHIAKKLV